MARKSWTDDRGNTILLRPDWQKGNYVLYRNGQKLGHVYRSGRHWRHTVTPETPTAYEATKRDFPSRRAAVDNALASI